MIDCFTPASRQAHNPKLGLIPRLTSGSTFIQASVLRPDKPGDSSPSTNLKILMNDPVHLTHLNPGPRVIHSPVLSCETQHWVWTDPCSLHKILGWEFCCL